MNDDNHQIELADGLVLDRRWRRVLDGNGEPMPSMDKDFLFTLDWHRNGMLPSFSTSDGLLVCLPEDRDGTRFIVTDMGPRGDAPWTPHLYLSAKEPATFWADDLRHTPMLVLAGDWVVSRHEEQAVWAMAPCGPSQRILWANPGMQGDMEDTDLFRLLGYSEEWLRDPDMRPVRKPFPWA